MATLKQKFEKATVDVRGLTKRPTNGEFQQLYGLYKQATAGDVAGKRPGALDLLGRGRYDGWAAYKGQSADDAMKQYIAVVESLVAKYK